MEGGFRTMAQVALFGLFLTVKLVIRTRERGSPRRSWALVGPLGLPWAVLGSPGLSGCGRKMYVHPAATSRYLHSKKRIVVTSTLRPEANSRVQNCFSLDTSCGHWPIFPFIIIMNISLRPQANNILHLKWNLITKSTSGGSKVSREKFDVQSFKFQKSHV